MGSVDVQPVATLARPLLVRGVLSGAALGALLSTAVVGVSAVQAVIVADEYASWGMNGRQVAFFGLLGFIIGALAGVVASLGSLGALWLEALMPTSLEQPDPRTAAVGAAATTLGWVILALLVMRLPAMTSLVVGVGAGTIAGGAAVFFTHRLTRSAQTVREANALKDNDRTES
jgi:hypothetical protein